RMGAQVEALRAIRDRVLALFPQARAAFMDADSNAARRVMEEHDALKNEVKGYLKGLSQETDISINLAVVLSISARMIGRASSHLSNIISSVVLPFDQIRRSPTWGDDE
ncbi:MAG: hypothetical protein R3284_08205, partial [Rubricoccaceae bacterium]|nr:hypothetical protein [Rubricoccaceae bacterium]